MGEDTLAGLISVVGGESTGKSTLTAALAPRLPAIVVGEHLRDWVDTHGRVPRAAEQSDLMIAQHQAERAALLRADETGHPWVVSDSGPLMTAVYSIQYYCDDSLLPRALEWTAQADVLVWCQDDFPWQPDPQRDGPDARAISQGILADIVAANPGLAAQAVRGPLSARVATVLGALSGRD